MRFAKTVTALALACSLALAIPTFAAPAAEEQAGRQEDLELLYQTIRDRHPGPFTNTPEQEFLARIAQIEARIDTEDSMSFGLDLQSLAALIGDSHTTTNLNSILSSGHMFPVSVKWMDGDWVLYQVDASHQGALGQQVTSVNGFSMDQVQEKMAPLISADNEIKLRRQLSQVFGHQEIMVYCGLLKPEEDLTLTLENGTSITLSPLSMQDQSGWPEINGLSQQRQGSAPTDYQKGTYYFSLPLDSRTYYIQYNQCMEDPELPMETFTAQVMADLEQGSYSVLLLDLRNNGGGSDGVIIPLLMELAPLVRRGELELWGLVGEATFSSASINALEIREMGGGLAKLRRQLSQVFGHQEIMVYCGLLKPEEDLTLTLENGTSITLSPLSMQDQSGWPEINGLSQQRQGSAPTDYQKGTYYFSLPLDSRTYYIQYNQCMEDPELPMETFTAQVMADLEQGSYSVLLLDLRNNGGGSDGVIIPLLMELAPLVRRGELELWGLVGEATFSSASINALEIREMGGGLAGEPTSGSVDHFGSTGSFTLPNTGVRVSMSTKFIDTGTLLECAAGLGVEPIQPDVTVYQTLEDYLAGQDTLVDALCARTEPFQPQERPDAPLSRGRLTELLRQAAEQAGLDTQAPMQSLSDLLPCAWYAPGVCWALSSGVASGTGEAMFHASRPVTRQEGAAMVWQTARLLGMSPSGTAELTDAGSIASWALDAAQWAVSAGGLDTQNGAFHPQDTLTRAEGEALLSLLP